MDERLDYLFLSQTCINSVPNVYLQLRLAATFRAKVCNSGKLSVSKGEFILCVEIAERELDDKIAFYKEEIAKNRE